MIRDLACLLLMAFYGNPAVISGGEAFEKSSKDGVPAKTIRQLSAVHRQKKPVVKHRTGVNRSRNVKMQKKTVFQILSDQALWGKDFPTVLSYLQSFENSGERQSAIFANKIVTTTPLKAEKDAKPAAERLNRSLDDLKANPTPLFQKLIQRAAGQPASLKAEILPYFAEDRSVRIEINSLELFSDKLTVLMVKKQLGQPEKVSTLLVETDGEERPLILTLYSYAEGAIVFAEADIAARPGFVNRVLLDIPKIVRALEREVK